MKKELFIYVVLLQFFWIGCQKEADLEPSNDDQHLFVVENKTGRFNELAYQIYQETGLPIFVNDTISKVEYGKDADGNTRYRYEMFIPGYIVTTTYPTSIALSSDTNAMVEATNIIREKVIPNLPRNRFYRPYSILLVDTLSTATYGWSSTTGRLPNYRPDYAYKGIMGISVGKLADILSMSDDEKSYWAGMILGMNLQSEITDLFKEELEDFYVLTDTAATVSFYGKGYNLNTITGVSQPLYHVEPETLGFLDWMLTGPSSYSNMSILYKRTPTKEIDVRMYIAAVYAYSEERMREKYADYPKCINKYLVMKRILANFKQKYDIE